MTHAINRTDTLTRAWMRDGNADGADPLTNLLNPGPNVSIIPEPEPWWKSQIHWPSVRLTLEWMALATICLIIALW